MSKRVRCAAWIARWRRRPFGKNPKLPPGAWMREQGYGSLGLQLIVDGAGTLKSRKVNDKDERDE